MSAPDEAVFLFDCDNTMLDDDRAHEDFRGRRTRESGSGNSDRRWEIFEALRVELDCVGALQRYRGRSGRHSAATDVLLPVRLPVCRRVVP
jgi:hypothetical protein